MKKNLLWIVASVLMLANTLYAEEANAVEHEKEGFEQYYYVTVKPMYTLGGDLKEGEEYFDGDNAYGIGVDIGYKFHPHFGIELALSYGSNDVTRTERGIEGELETATADGDYKSVAINLVYSQMLTEKVGYFVKMGYEIEYEKVSDFGIDENDHGVDAAAGLGYEINEESSVAVEYEHSAIKGLRGDAIFLVYEHKFFL